MNAPQPINILGPDKPITGAFVERPNRFLVRAAIDHGPTVMAFMPNPGRLHELLLPGVRLWLTKNHKKERATAYTAVAVERDGRPVLLHTHLNNLVARRLIEHGLVEPLQGWSIERAEVPHGHSRFDFLLAKGKKRLWLEVKSCTLFGNGVAMFPDAVTERGRRHLTELAQLSRQGQPAAVMFVIHRPDVEWFMPDYHTDLAFSQTLLEARKDVEIIPAAVGWNQALELEPRARVVPVPWQYLETEVQDGGAYLLLLHLTRRRAIQIGKLGRLKFEPGWCIYVGSARTNLSARVARHLRLNKKTHWHIDYLRAAADQVTALPVRSSADLECELAQGLGRLFAPGPPGFGSSDCRCPAHLFVSPDDPLRQPSFHRWLEKHRMARPLVRPGPADPG